MGKIYVLCPSQIVSGGPEALHQMVYYLRQVGLDSEMVYTRLSKNNYTIPNQYRVYIDHYILVDDIIDSTDNVIIAPETLNFYRFRFKNTRFFIWWLGIGNNQKQKMRYFFKKFSYKNIKKFLMKKNKILMIKDYFKYKRYDFVDEEKRVSHICASHYVYDYVKERSSNNVSLCIEPISIQFLEKEGISEGTHNSNVILYNPARNNEFTKKIIKKAKDLEFLPLRGFTQNQLIEKYQESKLYIDFGNFPGAERIPKEATICGCAVLTSRDGAAAYFEDVPVYDKYKFDAIDENIDLIIGQIRNTLDNYELIIDDFSEYRKVILSLEDNFKKALKEIFR